MTRLPALARRAAAALALCLSAPALGYVLKTGDTLASVAEATYGHRYYALVLAKLNRIKDAGATPPGTSIRTPDLEDMLFAEGLPRRLEPDLTAMEKARYSFMRLHAELDRALHPRNSKGKIQVPAALKKELSADADSLDRAGKSLNKAGNLSDSSTRLRQRLQAAGEIMRRLAGGATDAGLEDQVHLLFAQAYVRGLMWARGEDGDY